MIRFSVILVSTLVILDLVNAIPFQGPLSSHSRIVKGEKIDIKEAPFMAMLIRLSAQESSLICGGTILDSHHILTAAHCVRVSVQKVVVGSTTPKLPHAQEILVKKATAHPLYNRTSKDYDYAIVELAEDIKFSDTVKALPLNSSAGYVKPGEVMWTYGWGATQNYTDSEVTLRRVAVPAVGHKECQDQFSTVLTDRMLCTGFKKDGKSACSGDSGGPLIYNGVQVGVTSFGKLKCAEPGIVYARVGAVVDWIQEMTSG